MKLENSKAAWKRFIDTQTKPILKISIPATLRIIKKWQVSDFFKFYIKRIKSSDRDNNKKANKNAGTCYTDERLLYYKLTI